MPITPYPEADALLAELLARVQAVLGPQLVGMYVTGSLASGGFDADSDVDFVVVTEEAVSGAVFEALQAMHADLAQRAGWWATQLEGTYIGRAALRRYDSAQALHPNIERGHGERLKWAVHEGAWVAQLAGLRAHGIALAGPPPQTLIDPVVPDDLRAAMRAVLAGWARRILAEPARIAGRGYQSYVVLTLCRILYTLAHGTVVSKPAAAEWARTALDARWAPLIERAWAGRHAPGEPAKARDVAETLEFIRHALERGA